MSLLALALVVAFLITAALTRRHRQSNRYRIHDAEQYAADLSHAAEDDIVARQPAPFVADEGPYIGGARGYGRGGFGGRWDGLPNPDASLPRQEDDGSQRFPSSR
ncbi:MAG TPA: hypothetical protein VN229_12265 [Terriglobales bacterium]|nr:hypothetical protein [Terriglobales bacterium]